MDMIDLKPRHRSSGRVRRAGKRRFRMAMVLVAVALPVWYLLSGEEHEPPAGSSGRQTVTLPIPPKSSKIVEPATLAALEEAEVSPASVGPPPAPASESPADAVALAPSAPMAISNPDRDPDSSRGQRARTVLKQLRAEGEPVDPVEVYARAQEFKNAGLLADAYLLYFYAARQGHAMSAMALGTIHDPDYHSEFTSIMDKPDLSQAHKWYLQAAQDGDPVAKEHLDHLRERVELAAAGGDPEAQRLVLQWR